MRLVTLAYGTAGADFWRRFHEASHVFLALTGPNEDLKGARIAISHWLEHELEKLGVMA